MRKSTKQTSGIVTQCGSRRTKADSYAHSFYIGKKKFNIFSDDDLAPVSDGDQIRFDYEGRNLRTGSKKQYLRVLSESLVLLAPSISSQSSTGVVYILSNPSMPGLLKVGYTTRSTTQRAAELASATGIPTAFHIEYELVVAGDPYAVEQQAHALLAVKRTGKEFFKATVDEAKMACIQSFASLYPEEALHMERAFSEHAKNVIVRRKALTERQEEERRAHEEAARQKDYLNSPEGKWRLHGTCQLILEDFDPQKKRGKTAVFKRIFGKLNEDHFQVFISTIWDQGKIRWQLATQGFTSEKWFQESFTVESLDEAYALLETLKCSHQASNRRVVISVSNNLIENPPLPLRGYQSVHARSEPHSITSLDGLIFRSEPWSPTRKKFNSSDYKSAPQHKLVQLPDEVDQSRTKQNIPTGHGNDGPTPDPDNQAYAPLEITPCPLHGQMIESKDKKYWVCPEGPECEYYFRKIS